MWNSVDPMPVANGSDEPGSTMRAMTSTPPPVTAVTMGDPAGIGPDITLSAWARRDKAGLSAFAVLGDPNVFRARAESLGLSVPIKTIVEPGEARAVFANALPVLPVPLPHAVHAGKGDTASGRATIDAIEQGAQFVLTGVADALVTNPINKKILYEAGFDHPGHTEFLGALAEAHGENANPVMMLACRELRVVPATVHIPLKEVPSALTRQSLARTIKTTADALSRQFGIDGPRIAVTGLNPHAGENGAMGNEEIDVIAPVIDALLGEGLNLSGPHPADTIFQERLRDSYDAVVTMYHDQALVPIKTLAFDRAVNVTLGLPFIRTSPDHGTAYDLAGTGRANDTSFIEALHMAALLASRHRANR